MAVKARRPSNRPACFSRAGLVGAAQVASSEENIRCSTAPPPSGGTSKRNSSYLFVWRHSMVRPQTK